MNDNGTITTTTYLGDFHYTDEVLDFFPTAEGYVKVTEDANNSHFNYVFNYTDHLGNIRMRYTKNPDTGATEILEENHYYPFGLKHSGYNANHQMFIFDLRSVITLVPVTPGLLDGYKYKYQGQERQDELGLNWDSFKWRNYDYAMARFFNIDPLAEKYAYQSPYQFASNQPIHANEIEGLENPVDLNMRNRDAEKLSSMGHGTIKENYKAIQKAEARAIPETVKIGATFLKKFMVSGFNFVTGRGTNVGQPKGDNSIKTIPVDDILAAAPSGTKGINSKGNLVNKILDGVSDAAEAVSKADNIESALDNTASYKDFEDSRIDNINVINATFIYEEGKLVKIDSSASYNVEIKGKTSEVERKIDSIENINKTRRNTIEVYKKDLE